MHLRACANLEVAFEIPVSYLQRLGFGPFFHTHRRYSAQVEDFYVVGETGRLVRQWSEHVAREARALVAELDMVSLGALSCRAFGGQQGTVLVPTASADHTR